MIKKYLQFIKESIKNTTESMIKNILDFKYQKMKHIYTEQSQSDNYTMEVTNWDNSFYNSDVDGRISSIFLTSNNVLSDELKWYEENSKFEFLNGYNYDKLFGKGIELVTFIGDDDINEYFEKFNDKCDYIWGQYFTDSEKVDMNKAIAKTEYNGREIVIVIKYKF